tara:strand:+ start:210 stop:419 length:210 start_codon:yes stop_codon:yes gene_type:complete
MKTYEIEFVEECTSKVKIKAKSEKEAREIIESGDFIGDKIIDRDHFQITECYEISEDSLPEEILVKTWE